MNGTYGARTIDMADIQGLILRGYNFRFIRYMVFKIEGVQGAREFCSALLPGSGNALTITNAEPWPGGIKPDYCLNIGVTYNGMLKLLDSEKCDAVNLKTSRGLFNPFKVGAADPNNAQDVGDTDASAPANWWTRAGGWLLKEPPSPDGEELHLQLTLYTHSPASRDEYYNKLLAMIPTATGGAVVPAFYKDSDPIAVGEDLDYVHFGYKDSLSQPRIGNILWNKPKVRLLTGISTVDDRPVVPAYRFAIDTAAPDYNAHPLLENGTFAAFRLLYQDVAEFNKYINSDKNTSAELLAAKMCGRWFDGTPLVVSPDGEDKKLKDFDFTNFNYITPTPNQQGPRVTDDIGALCPYAAHIRRANPRDDGDVTGNQPLDGKPQYAGIHRVLRRASPYGPPYKDGEPAGIQRGLVGLFMGSSLTDQFIFIMKLWISAGGFRNPDNSPNTSGIDPLFGPQVSDLDPDNHTFDYYTNNGDYNAIPGLTRFIRTDGSLYLFFPGIKGLRYLSEGNIPA